MTRNIGSRYFYSYDIIRIIAVFLVIFTHTGKIGSKIYSAEGILNPDTIGYIGLDIIRTVNVPLFFMVSGALLLGKQENYKTILKKRIAKYVLTLCVIAAVYYFGVYGHPWNEMGIFLRALYRNDNSIVEFHLWFLYAYIGYLVMLPFLRKIALQMTIQDFKYFLILGFLFKGMERVLNGGAGLGAFAVSFVLGYDLIFYPLLGYCMSHLLSERHYNKKYLLIGIVGSLICIVITAIMMVYDFLQNGVWSERYLDMFTMIPTGTIFYMVKYLEQRRTLKSTSCRVVAFCGSNVMGIYLFSEMFFPLVTDMVYGPLTVYMPKLLACTIMIIANMILGLGLTSFLKCIPIVKKLL